MQCNAMQCNAMQCNAMQCNTKQCNAIQCNAMQHNAMKLSLYPKISLTQRLTNFLKFSFKQIQYNTEK